MKYWLFTIALLGGLGCSTPAPAPDTAAEAANETSLLLDRWTYIEVDSTKARWGDFAAPDWLRYFGLATGDVNGDGRVDIVTGRNVYLNPGGDLAGPWQKLDLGRNVDANLVLSTNADAPPLIIAEALPDVYTYQWADGAWRERVVAQVPPTGHHNGQGYRTAQIVPGGTLEVLLASQGGIYLLTPREAGDWPVQLVAADASDEGFAVADMDGDGDLDLVAGYRAPGVDAEVPTYLVWFANPGDGSAPWSRYPIGRTRFAIDRVEAGDLDGDGRADVIVAEERYPGLEPDASLYTYLQQDTGFVRATVVTQYSMNNLDLADFDRDGDTDIVTSEHKGEALRLQIWANDGSGEFTLQPVDRGKESHLGTRAVDIDGDGDLDLVSIGWDRPEFVHLWRNDAMR